MEIKSFIGRKFDNPNEIWKDLRKQIEQDRYLKNRDDLKLTYEYYTRPRNPLDFILKRYIHYPLKGRFHSRNSKNVIYQIHFQFLADIAHFLNKRKVIITCHDIYTFLKSHNLKNPKILQKYVLLGLKSCRYIIAISDFIKSELITKLNIPEENIIVIKNAINPEMFKPISQNGISEIKQLYPDYKKILYVGSEVLRKNILSLFKAFYLVKRKYKKIKLIRVGPKSYPAVIKSLGLEKDIVYFENISNERLREIYNLCDFFVTPSLYEGFGFPGLEAASCGTPVICSDIPVFRELYKDFPIFFPPKDYKTLAKIILVNINDESRKQEMSKKGINTSKKYSWKKSAEKYFKLAKYVINNS